MGFKYAANNNRKKVTVVHKANIMKVGDGMFLDACREVADKYTPTIQYEEMIIDNCCMQMVSRPEQFDVIVLPNLYGNIVGNVSAGLIGGPGVLPGANYGPEYAVFEPGVRHAAMDIAGTNKANPTATVLSAVEMLRYINMKDAADALETAVHRVYADKKILTADLGGNASTRDMTRAFIEVANAQ
eukprot:TRINITY_DN1618_c0_g1_i3.p2 TRINITY_DN1618_c0_g1~~TRINITY_DN1618_c0_g1_i3.p2  ORF type:complete len:186 (+),score=72.31 TRINITY_DN1618_c0_g1_i3:1405-1962(+)